MSVDHPFRTALYDGDIRIRLADGWDMPRIFDLWSHPSFISMFPEYEADGCDPDPEWLGQLLRSSVSRVVFWRSKATNTDWSARW